MEQKNFVKNDDEFICDNCGSILIKRDDDNVESFKVRFKTFLDNTDSILKYYEDKEKLIKIDVNKDVQDIFESILEVAND